MPVRTAAAEWKGALADGSGTLESESGALNTSYTWKGRAEDGGGTNPEELIAAAHAGCFSMALTAGLGKSGHQPKQVNTTARVHFEKQDAGFAITKIELSTEAVVPGIDESAFQGAAEAAKMNCPVSKALTGTNITLSAKLVQG
jgi:osmotically inducible protein OsmC